MNWLNQYYAVCKRELWFYLQDVDIDKENEHIHRGTRVDETAFAERRESVHLGMIVPDLLENGRVAEIKPSSDGPGAGRELQLYYYLWYFKHILGTEREGVLIYPTENKRETVTMRIDRFHSFWCGSQSSAKRWLRRFRYYYNRHRPNQALDGSTPTEEVLN